METTKKTTRKKTGSASGTLAGRIASAYKEQLLLLGARPASVYKFCLDLGISESEFYDLFGSFEGLERSLWKGFIDDTIARLEKDDAFASFSTHEKVLAFYYTLLEILKAERSFAVLQLGELRKPEIVPGFLKDFRARYVEFIGSILGEGKKNGEVAARPFLDKRYPTLFWIHFCLLLVYWKNDSSAGFERTDAYVEKSVRLAFEMMGKGVIDSAIDFAKFIYQSKK